MEQQQRLTLDLQNQEMIQATTSSSSVLSRSNVTIEEIKAAKNRRNESKNKRNERRKDTQPVHRGPKERYIPTRSYQERSVMLNTEESSCLANTKKLSKDLP